MSRKKRATKKAKKVTGSQKSEENEKNGYYRMGIALTREEETRWKELQALHDKGTLTGFVKYAVSLLDKEQEIGKAVEIAQTGGTEIFQEVINNSLCGFDKKIERLETRVVGLQRSLEDINSSIDNRLNEIVNFLQVVTGNKSESVNSHEEFSLKKAMLSVLKKQGGWVEVLDSIDMIYEAYQVTVDFDEAQAELKRLEMEYEVESKETNGDNGNKLWRAKK